MKELNLYFDHTMLKPEATEEDIRTLCREAKEYGFFAVCVNSCYVPMVKQELKGTNVKTACVVGFPLGACSTAVKAFEAQWASEAGADEIDMVLNIGAMKDGKKEYVLKDIHAVAEAAKTHGAIVKVILETCLLTDEEIIEACCLAEEAGAKFVKTSTGFSKGGAACQHVALMRKAVGSSMEVKASGGIRTWQTAKAMIEAGADRIGSSASVGIVEEAREQQ